MNKLFHEINRNPSRSTLLQLSGVFLVGFGIIGALQYFRWGLPEKATVTWAVALGLTVSAQLPVLGRWVYLGWMGIGVLLGLVVQPIVMFVAFTLFFVPVGFLFKLLGRDLMRRTLNTAPGTYWEDYPETSDPKSYFRQG
jgi:hypothetical protein